MRGLRVRGLKTFAATRSDAVKSKFIAPSMKRYLFGTDPQLQEDQRDPSDAPSPLEAMKLPRLHGNSILSHVQELERHSSDYANLLKGLASGSCPPLPDKWLFEPGWTCYSQGCEPHHVDFPDEDALFFDAEVCVRESFAPVLATAVSGTAWYSWVSPALIHNQKKDKKHVFISDLVSMGNQGQRPRVVVGHYVCFDSARIKECYDLPMSGLKFFDTMAAHIAVSGVSDLQRYFILKAANKPEWANLASGNSLSHVHRLYCGSDLNKTVRDVFVHGSLSDIAERFQELCMYCALDVKATQSVFHKLLPLYFERLPHGATLNALLQLSSMLVPVNGDWADSIEKIRGTCAGEDKEVKVLLQELAKDALNLMHGKKYERDPWMWDQDWSISYRKKKEDIGTHPHPEWYKKLTSQVNSDADNGLEININFRRNIAAKLMQLCWSSYPLHYEQEYGWGMLLPALKSSTLTGSNVPVDSVKAVCDALKPKPRITSIPTLRDFVQLSSGITSANSGINSKQYSFKKKDENFSHYFIQSGLLFKKLPHPIKMERNVGGVLSVHLLTNQCIRSSNAKAKRILEILRKNVFWNKNGKPIETLPIVWFNEELSKGAVVPSACAFGDFIRHPKELLFSSLCDEDGGSTGLEMSTVLSAPPGWCFLSANFAQADLWVTSLLADSLHGQYCASPIGKQFVEGTVYQNISEGTSLSLPQSELVFRAVMWGARRRFLASVVRGINPVLGELTVYQRIDALLEYLYGVQNKGKADKEANAIGVLSDFQQVLEKVLEENHISTPFLENRLSRALESGVQQHLPLVHNWLVRSSVADYLHVLMLCFHDFQSNARLCTISSNTLLIKYLVPYDKKYHAAKSLHLAHLYSVAFCAARLGLPDVPKVAAELPYVTLSPTIREDVSSKSQKLTFEEAIRLSKSECINNDKPSEP